MAKGKTLIELERFQEAIECYNKVLEIDSNDSEAINKRNFLLQKIQEESNIFKKNENLNIDLITNDVDITLDLRDKSNESNHNLCVTDCAKKNALNILEKNKQAIETFKKSEKDQNYLVAIKIKNPSFKRSDSKKLSKIENMNKGFENYQKIEVYNKSINRNLIFKRKQDDEENKKKANEYYNKALNEKDMKKKLDFFDKSIKLNPNVSEVYCAKGNTLNNLERYHEAMECCDKVIAIDPNYSIAIDGKNYLKQKIQEEENKLKANVYYIKALNETDLNTKLELFDKSIELNSNLPEVYCTKGNTLYNLERYQEAIDCYDKVIEIDPNYSIAIENKNNLIKKIQDEEKKLKANEYFNKGLNEADLNMKLELFDKSIELNIDFTDAYLAKGNTLNNLERYQEAIECYNKVIEIDQNDTIAINTKNNLIQKIQDEENKLKANDYFNKGLNETDDKIKIDLFNKSIELNSNVSDVYLAKGNTLIDLEKYHEAIQCYNKVIQMNPNNSSEAIYNKGEALYHLNKYQEAIKCYNKALESNPNNSDIYNDKGNALYNLDKYIESIECYNKSIELKPNESYYFNKGFALIKLKKFQDAIECFNKAIELNPDNSIAYFNKGNILNDLKRYSDAIQCYDKAIKFDKNSSSAYYFNKGNALNKLRKFQDAILCYNKAIEINPDDSDIYLNKGEALAQLKRYQEAIESYNKTIELNPNDSDAYLNKGNALDDIKRYKEAIDCYNKVIELKPNDSRDAYYNRNLTLEKIKNIRKY